MAVDSGLESRVESRAAIRAQRRQAERTGRRTLAIVAVGGVLLAGYAGLDIADAAPGVLTTKPEPPPPPTETPGKRVLPSVPQPSFSTSVRMPLGPLAGDGDAPSPAGVKRALAGVIGLPALRDSALVVRDGQSGEVLFERDGDGLRIPASTTKLLSAAAVGGVFELDDTLETKVVQGAAGHVVLVAGGDTLLSPGKGSPDLVAGRAGLADLADEVAKSLKDKGARNVTLDVDESYAPGPRFAPTWDRSFGPTGITGAVAMLGLSTQRAGHGVAGAADPVGSTWKTFAGLLGSRGIDVEVGERRSAPVGGQPVVLGSVESAPVRDQLALALTESDNALTEILVRQAAFRGGVTKPSFAATGGWVVSQVGALGVDVDGVRLVDGSGLSRENRVTADLLTDVLVLGYDGQHPVLRTALDGMPISGLTGTLADRFGTDSTHDAAGRARAKTGTLTGANALAGSVVDDSGRLLVFAGLVADAPTLDARAALDRFVAAIAACGCT